MRRLIAILALAAACSLASDQRAEAIVLNGSDRIGTAADESRIVEEAHCRPGRRHHRARPYDGCRKAERRGPAIVQPPPRSQPPAPGNWGFRHNGSFGSLHEAW